MQDSKTTVILGGAGKTGRRVATRLAERGIPHRLASRSAEIPFDWADEGTWEAAIAGSGALYLTYYPDLAMPGAATQVEQLTRLAVDSGVERLVLLAGRGEPQVEPAEAAVRESGVGFTLLECAFFDQNFDEGWVQPVEDVIAFPGGGTLEPFIDCEDIADVAVEALIDAKHDGQTYELTGPRCLSFHEAVETLAEASGRPLRYLPVSLEQYGEMLAEALPPEEVRFFLELFGFLMDGHNASTADGVQRALGRAPRDFRDYARVAAKGMVR